MSSAVELAARGEHPQDRAELGAERGQALGEEIADPFAGIGEPRAGDADSASP